MPDDFPQFDVPSEVSGSSPAPSATPAAPPDASAAAPAAPAPATEPAEYRDPLFAPFSHPPQEAAPAPVAAPATPAAGTPAATPEGERLSPTEVLLAQQTQLLATLAQRLTQPPAAPKPGEAPPARDPKDVALEQVLVKRIPALGPLLEAMNDPVKARALQGILEAAPQHAQTVQTFYQEYAEQTVEGLKGIYAEAYGVDAKTLTREDENFLSDQFQLWVQKPENGRALQRYEAGDLRVVTDFGKFFKQRFVQPAKRQGVHDVAQRAATVAALPRGGGSQIPTPAQSARPVQTPAGERDVFAEAWGDLQRTRAAG